MKPRDPDDTPKPRRGPAKIVNSKVSFAKLLGGRDPTNVCEALPQEQTQPQSQYPIPPNVPNQQQPHQHQIQYVPPPPNATDLTSLLTSFLSEFKSLVTPLISLLTNLVSHLIPPLKNP